MSPQASKYCFGPYELHTRARELYKHGTKLKLRPQLYQVLQVLVKRAGDVVTREELHQMLWSAETFVDFEQGLNTSIKELRGVLSDSAREPRYIETLPKLGYRFIVPAVTEIPMAASEAVAEPQTLFAIEGSGQVYEIREAIAEPPTIVPESVVEGGASARKKSRLPTRWLILIGASVLLLAGLGGYRQWARSWARTQPSRPRVLLAVLPFENLTGDTGQDYFSDGLTEEMITQLGRIDPQHLGVIARTSVLRYKQGHMSVGQVGDDLGVQYVLEGSVRRNSDRVRIAAQFIQVHDQTHLWAREYDRELKDLLVVQGEIAEQIADEIQLTLGTGRTWAATVRPSALTPQSYEAYDLYLKGRYLWNQRTPGGFQQAVACFMQAIARDPNNARAYAGLADAYALMSSYYLAPPNEVMPKARAAALKALQIDDGLAEAHTSLALILETYDWDWRDAEKEYLRAIQLDSNYATAHHWYAEFLAFQGRFDEAFAESERARQSDPLSRIIAADHAAIFYFSRQYDRALQEARGILDMDPNQGRAQSIMFASLIERGQLHEALSKTQDTPKIGTSPWIERWDRAALASLYGRLGQRQRALQVAAKLETRDQPRFDTPAILAPAYAGLDNDRALFWLEKAYLEHSAILSTLKVDPAFDPLRGDPRFQGLLRRVGLAQ
ncbi:MAG: winged helix-turn-helix domain-containing protein [Acidobacteriia bacterium]|nr:winged helix-turn-helix domain-containing protein [Terriglobia bacterium]